MNQRDTGKGPEGGFLDSMERQQKAGLSRWGSNKITCHVCGRKIVSKRPTMREMNREQWRPPRPGDNPDAISAFRIGGDCWRKIQEKERRALELELAKEITLEDTHYSRSRPGPALLIHADGSMEVVNPTNWKFTLEQLEKILGGQVRSAAVGSFSFVVNAEENPEAWVPKKGVPRNELATLMVLADDLDDDVYIAGTVLLCPERMIP